VASFAGHAPREQKKETNPMWNAFFLLSYNVSFNL